MPANVTADVVEERLIDVIATFGPERDLVTRTATFEELDIDSLDLVELAQVAEEEWGIELRAEDVKEIKTVGEAIDLVVARL